MIQIYFNERNPTVIISYTVLDYSEKYCYGLKFWSKLAHSRLQIPKPSNLKSYSVMISIMEY